MPDKTEPFLTHVSLLLDPNDRDSVTVAREEFMREHDPEVVGTPAVSEIVRWCVHYTARDLRKRRQAP